MLKQLNHYLGPLFLTPNPHLQGPSRHLPKYSMRAVPETPRNPSWALYPGFLVTPRSWHMGDTQYMQMK